MLNSIREFHVKHGYYLLTEKLEKESGLRLVLPQNVLVGGLGEAVAIKYTIVPNNDDYVTITKSLENCPALIPVQRSVPSYAARVAIVADLTFTCIQNNYDTQLLVSFDENGNMLENEQTYFLLQEPTTQEHKAKELSFRKVFESLAHGKECSTLARATGVEEGYLLLLEIFREGGI